MLSGPYAPPMIAPVNTARRGFLSTRWSLVLRVRGKPTPASRAALAELCAAYRAPLLTFARRLEADPQRAEDILQGFLANVVEQFTQEKPSVFSSADPARGRFRSYLCRALRNHAYNARDTATSQKAGGRARRIDADPDELASDDPGVDSMFDRAWARVLTDRAMARLAAGEVKAGRGALFELLRGRLGGDEEGAPLREVGDRLGVAEGTVKRALHDLRKRYGKALRAEVAETVARPEDVDAELRHLLSSFRDGDVS